MLTTDVREQEPKAALPSPEERKALPTPEEPKGSGARKWIIVAVILLVVGVVVWKIRDSTRQQQAETTKMAAAADRPTPVMVAAVQQRTMPIYLTALGTVTAYNTVTIKSRVDGQLLTVNVREGQAVRKGQVLAQIDPAPYQAAVAQAEGTLAKDQANAANAQAEAARYTALFQAGVVSKESQQSQVSSAGQAAGSIKADQAAIQAAKVNVAYTRITSPIDGVVGLRQVDAGNIVHASDTNGLLVITQLQPIAVIFTLPEDQLPQVLKLTRSGTTLGVEAYDRSETTHLASGKLLTVDNQIDPTTGTDKVKAVFDNKDGALFPNQFVNVRLILQDRPNAIVIPAVALQNGIQGNFVYVVKPGQPPAGLDTSNAAGGSKPAGQKPARAAGAGGDAAGSQNSAPYYVEAQPVKVDLTEGSQVILASGLNPGDQIVVDGQEKLRNGAKVIPRTMQGRPAGTGNTIGAGSSAAGSAGNARHGGNGSGQAGSANSNAGKQGQP